MSDDVILRTKDLRKTFQHPSGEIEVLKGIQFDLIRGSMTAILGPSGSGKSTFLHLTGTLDAPTSGHVEVDGKDVFRLRDQELSQFRNRTMGFVFQFHYLLPEFSSLENVLMPAWIAEGPRDSQRKRALELLEIVKLDHRLRHRPMELSGGEQQRVSLARALMMNPRIIFTDELTGNLDHKAGREVMEYLQLLSSRFGVTVLSVTHQRNLAESFYKFHYTMSDGVLHPGIDDEP